MKPEAERQGTILILFPNIRSQNRASLYWGPVFDGISERLNEKGMDILTLTEPSSDRMFSVLNPDAISGVITVGTISTSVLLEIYRLRIPLVMVDHEDPAIYADSVFTDNMKCMKELVLMLVGKGYRKFQFAGQLPDAASFRERWLGYRTVLEEKQLEGNSKKDCWDQSMMRSGDPLLKWSWRISLKYSCVQMTIQLSLSFRHSKVETFRCLNAVL